MGNRDLERDGFCLLRQAVSVETVQRLLDGCRFAFDHDSNGLLAQSSRGHVYAARNLIESIPDVTTIWRGETLLPVLRMSLGKQFGLVRALFFDKPPDRTWSLPWHKDTSIAVKDNSIETTSFSRPTIKAGVPHVVASDGLLRQMLTLRIHLDEVTEENGPLRVVPGSHLSSDHEGERIESAVAIHAKAGDVLAMRPLISHSSGSSVPGTTRHRRVLHLEFAGLETLPDGYEWHDFIRP